MFKPLANEKVIKTLGRLMLTDSRVVLHEASLFAATDASLWITSIDALGYGWRRSRALLLSGVGFMFVAAMAYLAGAQSRDQAAFTMFGGALAVVGFVLLV